MSSGASEALPLVTTWFETELTLLQKLDSSHAPIEPFEAVAIFGIKPRFFLAGTDFVILSANFHVPAYRKYSKLPFNSLVAFSSGSSSAQLNHLANFLQVLKKFLSSFSEDALNFLLASP